MRRFASFTCLVLLGCAVVSEPAPANASQEKVDFHVSASGPRALADAIIELGRENDWIITYEDPQWRSAADRVVKFPPPTNRAQPVFVTRDSRVDVTYHAERGSSEEAKAEAAVRAILNDYHSRQGPGEFGVRREWGLLHVVPTAALNAVNARVAYESPLDKPISWQGLVESGRDTFDGILAAISAAGGRQILMGQPNVRLPQRVVLTGLPSGKPVTGRAILAAAVRAFKGHVTWRILCQPGHEPCYFNLRGW